MRWAAYVLRRPCRSSALTRQQNQFSNVTEVREDLALGLLALVALVLASLALATVALATVALATIALSTLAPSILAPSTLVQPVAHWQWRFGTMARMNWLYPSHTDRCGPRLRIAPRFHSHMRQQGVPHD
jgi:hypothetical protein